MAGPLLPIYTYAYIPEFPSPGTVGIHALVCRAIVERYLMTEDRYTPDVEYDERLERLIKEQEADMRRGEYQDNEPGVVSYSALEFEDGIEYMLKKHSDHRDINRPECYLHGRESLKLRPGTYAGWRCSICEAESGRKYRSRPEVKEILRERTAEWKKAHPEEVKEYAREYKRRRYAEDPEYRAKEQKRVREYKRRVREEAKHNEALRRREV